MLVVSAPLMWDYLKPNYFICTLLRKTLAKEPNIANKSNSSNKSKSSRSVKVDCDRERETEKKKKLRMESLMLRKCRDGGLRRRGSSDRVTNTEAATDHKGYQQSMCCFSILCFGCNLLQVSGKAGVTIILTVE
jgi:hypothetical protein